VGLKFVVKGALGKLDDPMGVVWRAMKGVRRSFVTATATGTGGGSPLRRRVRKVVHARQPTAVHHLFGPRKLFRYGHVAGVVVVIAGHGLARVPTVAIVKTPIFPTGCCDRPPPAQSLAEFVTGLTG
jgi:hypothetical protein